VACEWLLTKDAIEENFKRAGPKLWLFFGKDDMLVEKDIGRPRHIEVQILGDKYGDVVHLYDRDCPIYAEKISESHPKSLN
jgi:Pyruvate carboxylase